MINIAEVKKVLAKSQTRFFKNANSYSIGVLKSRVRGTGLQFKEHQVYSHGDDVRFIDWKMLAKTSHPYIKTFEEERNVEIILVLEVSPTLLAGSSGVSKLQACIEIACMLYLMADKTGDMVHLVLVTNDIYELPKMRGEKGMRAMLEMLKKQELLTDNLEVAYDRVMEIKDVDQAKLDFKLNKLLYKKKEVIILSDFLGQIRGSAITHLARHSHVQCFRVIAPIDESINLPYAVFGPGLKRAGQFTKMHLGDELEQEALKHVVPIRMKDGHLEQFVREMS
tara:strand:+ start:16226 stop:17068 length:843 start_codon:yes stop_codon:yes gene_type:complete